MSAISEDAKTWLTRRVAMDHDIVTYRVLSREFSIHVNVAKRWLEEFLEQSKSTDAPVHATYVVSGEALPTPAKSVVSSQDEDGPESSQASSSKTVDSVPTSQMIIAPEADLEQCKGRFVRVTSVHVYSLSPASVKDASLLVTSAGTVRQADLAAKSPQEHADAVGMILNPRWNEKPSAGKLRPAQTMQPPPAPAASISKKTEPVPGKEKDTTKSSTTAAPVEKKKTGTLDWGKAKPKVKEDAAAPAPVVKTETTRGTKREASSGSDSDVKNPKPAVKAKTEASTLKLSASASASDSKAKPSSLSKPTVSKPSSTPIVVPDSSTPPTPKPTTPKAPQPSTTASSGTARIKKRVLMSDTEEEEDVKSTRDSPPPPTKRTKRVLGGSGKAKAVNLSDDDEEPAIKKKKSPKANFGPKSKQLTKSERAMLDSDDEIDDDPLANEDAEDESDRQQSGSESEPEHVPLSAAEARRTLKGSRKPIELSVEAAAKREKKEKAKAKAAASGGAGRVPKGKKRVMKERTTVNAKGRTVTEDYWTLESASDAGDDEPASATETEAVAKPIRVGPPKKKAPKTPAKADDDEVTPDEKPTAKSQPKPKPKARASSARDSDTDSLGPPKTKRKSEAAPAKAKPVAKAKENPQEKEKSSSAAPSKEKAHVAPALAKKKSGQSTLNGFFKK